MSLKSMPQTATYERSPNNGSPIALKQALGFDAGMSVSEVSDGDDIGRYDRLARAFHWIFAGVIIYVSSIGFALGHIGNRATHDFLSHLNMSLGTVLLLMFPLRLLWKWVRVDPPPLPGVSGAQRKLAHGVHGALYLIVLAVLISGFLMVPHGYAFFGYEIPTPFERGPLIDSLFLFHRGCCMVLVGLVALHVLAVVKHQWIERRNILSRML